MPESAQCLRCQRIAGQVLGPLCDVASQSVILLRGRAFCRWVYKKERGSQRSVRFNPVLDICEFSKVVVVAGGGDNDSSVLDATDDDGGSLNSGIEMTSDQFSSKFDSKEANNNLLEGEASGSEFNRTLSP